MANCVTLEPACLQLIVSVLDCWWLEQYVHQLLCLCDSYYVMWMAQTNKTQLWYAGNRTDDKQKYCQFLFFSLFQVHSSLLITAEEHFAGCV